MHKKLIANLNTVLSQLESVGQVIRSDGLSLQEDMGEVPSKRSSGLVEDEKLIDINWKTHELLARLEEIRVEAGKLKDQLHDSTRPAAPSRPRLF